VSFNLLLSYALVAGVDLRRIRASMPCGRLMIDSGAFSVHKRNQGKLNQPISVSLDDYASYLEEWSGCWDYAITLDVIGDPAASRQNTRRLHERGLPVLPVFTRGDKLADLRAMLNDTRYVCAGGLVGMNDKYRIPRLQVIQRHALEFGGGVHALGIGSLPALRATRPYSADTSRFLMGYGFHTVQVFDGRDLHSVDILDQGKMLRYRDLLVSHGFGVTAHLTDRRMPEGNKPGLPRWINSQALGVAAACADEYLKQTYPVPMGADPGLHFYAVAIRTDAYAIASTDSLIHSDEAPPVWQKYRRHHVCTPRKENVA